jgi:hypothetical protein
VNEPRRPVYESFPVFTVERGGIEYVRPRYPLVPIPRHVVLFPRWDAAVARIGRVRRWPLRIRYRLAYHLHRLAVRLDDSYEYDPWA